MDWSIIIPRADFSAPINTLTLAVFTLSRDTSDCIKVVFDYVIPTTCPPNGNRTCGSRGGGGGGGG